MANTITCTMCVVSAALFIYTYMYTCTVFTTIMIWVNRMFFYDIAAFEHTLILQVNEKSFDLKREYRDGIHVYKKEGDKTGMDGWMDGCCHGDNLRCVLINWHKPYLLS